MPPSPCQLHFFAHLGHGHVIARRPGDRHGHHARPAVGLCARVELRPVPVQVGPVGVPRGHGAHEEVEVRALAGLVDGEVEEAGRVGGVAEQAVLGAGGGDRRLGHRGIAAHLDHLAVHLERLAHVVEGDVTLVARPPRAGVRHVEVDAVGLVQPPVLVPRLEADGVRAGFLVGPGGALAERFPAVAEVPLVPGVAALLAALEGEVRRHGPAVGLLVHHDADALPRLGLVHHREPLALRQGRRLDGLLVPQRGDQQVLPGLDGVGIREVVVQGELGEIELVEVRDFRQGFTALHLVDEVGVTAAVERSRAHRLVDGRLDAIGRLGKGRGE